MRNLILLLIKNGGLLLFLFLEGICMFLVVQFNKNQKDIYFSTTSAISGAVYNQVDEISKYWNLSSVADSLARENAKLYRQLDEVNSAFTSRFDTTWADSSQAIYSFHTAKVVSNSISGYNNHLIINIGSAQGVTPGMGVIGNGGIVGIVRSVTKHYALVMSILHKQSRISAAIKRNGHFGFLVWQNNDPRFATLIDIPKHVNVVERDTIVTSGYSTIFPEGLSVGHVKGFDIDPGSNSYTIDVELSNDLSSIAYVYVVKHLMKEELQSLQEEVTDE